MAEKGGIIVSEPGLSGLPNHTEIAVVFNAFLANHPEAKEQMTNLSLAPWNKYEWKLMARRFKFVPDGMIKHFIPFGMLD